MNKEEIENIEKIKKMLNFTTEGTSLRINNEVSKLLLKYIKQLEQKETILDKVTYKLKEDILKTKEEIKYWEGRYRNAKESNKKSFYRQINRCQSKFETLRGILEIIEGEKKNERIF